MRYASSHPEPYDDDDNYGPEPSRDDDDRDFDDLAAMDFRELRIVALLGGDRGRMALAMIHERRTEAANA